MGTELYIKGKKMKGFINLGWYKGEEFWLIKFGLGNYIEGIDFVSLFDLQFLKFKFLLGFEWDK